MNSTTAEKVFGGTIVVALLAFILWLFWSHQTDKVITEHKMAVINGTVAVKGFSPDGYARREYFYIVVIDDKTDMYVLFRCTPHQWRNWNVGDKYPNLEK
jgi:hypothetical protein